MDVPKIPCSFTTPRLRVSPWHSVSGGEAPRDLAAVVMGLLTPNVTASLPEPWRGPYSRSRAAAWIEDRDSEGTVLLVEDQAHGHPVGLLLLHDSSEPGDPNSELRIGYLVAEAFWGRGFASELIRGFADWAREASYGQVVAGVERGNAPSKRVLEKSGFVQLVGEDGTEDFYVLRS